MDNNIKTIKNTGQLADEVDDVIVFIDDEVRICVTTIPVNHDVDGDGCAGGKGVDESDRSACTNGIVNTNDISPFLPNNDDDSVACDGVSFDTSTCTEDRGSVRHDENGMVKIGRCQADGDDTVAKDVSCEKDTVVLHEDRDENVDDDMRCEEDIVVLQEDLDDNVDEDVSSVVDALA